MIDYLVANQTEILLAFTSLVTAASVIVKLTPTPKDDVAVDVILKVLKVIALNKSSK